MLRAITQEPKLQDVYTGRNIRHIQILCEFVGSRFPDRMSTLDCELLASLIQTISTTAIERYLAGDHPDLSFAQAFEHTANSFRSFTK